MPSRFFGRGTLAIIAAAYVCALPLPALSVPGGPTLSGLDVLLDGWEGLSAGVPAWYANPVFAAALALGLMSRARPGAALSALALALALSSFAAERLAGLAGRSVPEFSFRPGFYLWLAALAALAVWFAGRIRNGRQPVMPKTPDGHSRRD